MINEIFIENNKVDISEGISNLITYAIDDLRDIGYRNTSFSKTIVLPGTANNNKLFGHIFDFNVINPYSSVDDNAGINFNASQQADCIIFQNHIQVFKGILRVLKIVVTNGVPEYECSVFGELGGLKFELGARKLEDLDFSAYDHVFNTTNIIGSWDNVSGGTYFYPLADYGNVSTDKISFDISTLRPALYVKEYIEKIFAATGYTYQFDLADTSRFKSLIIPNNQKQFQKLSNYLLDVYTTGPRTYTTLDYVIFDVRSLGSFTENVDQDTFTFSGTDTYSTTFNVELNVTIEGQGYRFTADIFKNGASVYNLFDVSRYLAGAITFTENVADLPVEVANGDIFTIQVRIYNLGGIGSPSIIVNEAIWNIRTPNAVYSDINVGDAITISDTIPRNILQSDFISSIAKLFNLYIYEDNLQSKFLYIKPYVDFYDFNASGITDWTYKMDRSKSYELTPMSELNSRFYDFKFKADNDYYNELYRNRYNEGYGDYVFDSEFSFANDRTAIELIFSPTPLVGYSGLDKIMPTYFKQQSSGFEQEFAPNIRILQAKKITGVSSWNILNGATTLVSTTNYGYAGHYDDPDAPSNDIHFGVPAELFFTLVTGAVNVTQFNVYWSEYMAEITDKDSKLLSAFFKLSNKDIYNLDFSKPIYISGSYFRLSKIIDWNATEPDVTKCELLKVINTIF